MAKIFSQFPILADAPLLKDLTSTQREQFLSKCRVKIAEKPTALLSQGQKPDGVYLLAEGTIEISHLSPEGHKTIIAHDGPNRALGAIEAVANQPCVATCTAFAGTTYLRWSPADFVAELQEMTFLRNFAELAYTMLEYDNATKAIDQFYSAEQRICRYLDRLSNDNQIFAQSQSYLANAVGCTRQTVNKELSLLRERGIIDISKGKVAIKDKAALDKRIDELQVRRAPNGM